MTREAPTIHFVLPYVGDPAYLRLAVGSVLAQTDPRWRLTVVEDGPQGQGVSEWLGALDDERVTHVMNAVNLGINRTFQRCLDLSDGLFVTFLGCDDVLLSNYVATMTSMIESNPGAGVIQPGVEVIDADGHSCLPLADRVKRWVAPRSTTSVDLGGESAVASLLHGNWTYFPSLCWRRDAIAPHGFRQDLPTTLDLALLIDVLFDGWRLAVTPEIAFRYRRHAHSVSSLAATSAARFEEEALLFAQVRRRSLPTGGRGPSRAARLRVTSRLHAASLVTRALVRRTATSTPRCSSGTRWAHEHPVAHSR